MRTRPNFEKKELALSAVVYTYLPFQFPVYAFEVSHREEIDGELLQQALDKTTRRMPYVTDTLEIENGAIYFAKNPLPMEAAHTAQIRRVGGAETNYHLIDLTWNENKTWFSVFHGLCDGQGFDFFVESVLYHYYCLKDGVDYEPNGIRSEHSRITNAETADCYTISYPVPPDFAMPGRRPRVAAYHLPEIIPNPGGEILEYSFRIPSTELIESVKANATSPVVLLGMMVSEAILRVHPDADLPIMANIPISVRQMLGLEDTFKNCSSMITLPVGGTPMDALPFAERAAQLRAMLKQQLDPNLHRAANNMIGSMLRKKMADATDYHEEVKKATLFSNVTHDTFQLVYLGSLHKTAYSNQITDVHSLCPPTMGNTMSVYVIEHEGQFRVDCLACSNISPITDALELVFKEHGFTVGRYPVQSFTLPLTAWLEGML